jgi:hypothetical protein
MLLDVGVVWRLRVGYVPHPNVTTAATRWPLSKVASTSAG